MEKRSCEETYRTYRRVGGRSGTLGEYSIAYEAGKFIAVLTATGGVAEAPRSREAPA
jgi:hypothetical protein